MKLNVKVWGGCTALIPCVHPLFQVLLFLGFITQQQLFYLNSYSLFPLHLNNLPHAKHSILCPFLCRFFFLCMYLIPRHTHRLHVFFFFFGSQSLLLPGNICSRFFRSVPLLNALFRSPHKPLGYHKKESNSLTSKPCLPDCSGMQKWHKLLLQPGFGQHDPVQCLVKVSVAHQCPVCAPPPHTEIEWVAGEPAS